MIPNIDQLITFKNVAKVCEDWRAGESKQTCLCFISNLDYHFLMTGTWKTSHRLMIYLETKPKDAEGVVLMWYFEQTTSQTFH